jgi:photosystem II stability/assembly factor-like uncharacterized protein
VAHDRLRRELAAGTSDLAGELSPVTTMRFSHHRATGWLLLFCLAAACHGAGSGARATSSPAVTSRSVASSPDPAPSHDAAPSSATVPSETPSIRPVTTHGAPVRTSVATVLKTAPAADRTPPGAVGVLALSERTLVAAASDGLWRSTDAGRTWHRTLTLPAAAATETLARAGSGVVGSVSVVSNAPIGRTDARLYFSADGDDWREVSPAVSGFGENYSLAGLRIAFDGTGSAAHGLAFRDVYSMGASSGPLLHSDDGGRHWSAVMGLSADDAEVHAVSFVPRSRTAFAVVTTRPLGECDSAIVRSDDAGATWRRAVNGCPVANLGSLSFPDAEHGFAGGDSLLTTNDGGNSWQRRSGRPHPFSQDSGAAPYASVDFSSATNGFGIPAAGEVWRTTDGGRTWSDTAHSAMQVSSYGQTVVTAGGSAAPPGLAVSRDDGATWSRAVAPTDLNVQQLYRSGAGLYAVTNNGVAASTDQGRTWAAYPRTGPRLTPATVAVAGGTVLRSDLIHVARSPDGGATWAKVSLPAGAGYLLIGGLAFNSSAPRLAVAVFSPASGSTVHLLASSDNARSFQLIASPAGLTGGPIGYDGQTVVIAGWAAEASDDAGRHWTTAQHLPGYHLSAAGVSGRYPWVAGSDDKGDVLVAVSRDGGASWDGHTLRRILADPYDGTNLALSALSGSSAVLALGDSSLWRTTDAGATWHQEHPRLPTS